MRRILFVLGSSATALAGIFLLFNLFHPVSASPLPNLPEEDETSTVESAAVTLPIPDNEADQTRSIVPVSSAQLRTSSDLRQREVSLKTAAPQASIQMDVNYAHEWVAGTTDAYASVMVTVTNSADNIKETATVSADDVGDYFVSCDDWDSGDCPDISPGDKVYASVVGAISEVNPVGSISGTPNEVENTVSGELNANWFAGPLDVYCDVWEESGPPSVIKSVDPNGGTFECDFDDVSWDLQKGQTVAVRYYEPDGDSVINIIPWPWTRVNYGHDWVGADYEAGHTFWITVTDEVGAVKALAAATSESGQGWGGDGFDTQHWQWSPEQPDIIPSDLVYFAADDGYTNMIDVGTINGSLNVGADIMSGQIFATGFGVSLTVECHPWGAWDAGFWDAPVKYSWAEPDGSVPFSCQWDPLTEWDIQPGQDLAVMYQEPDLDLVIDVYREPAPDLGVWKWNTGNYARPDGYVVYGIQYRNDGNGPAENVTIVDTLPNFTSYFDDTSGLPVAVGPGSTVTWDLGTVEPGEDVRFAVTLHVDPGAPTGPEVIDPNCISIQTTSEGDTNTDNDSQCTGPVDIWDDEVEIGVSKWAEPNDPTPGHEFEYRIESCNYRGAAAGPVVLTDTLPVGVSLLEWWAGGDSLWSESSYDGTELVLYAPALPGDYCDQINLRVLLDSGIPISTTLENLVVLNVPGDVYTDNNWQLDDSAHVSLPRLDLRMDKTFNNGSLTPGGFASFSIDYSNDGNVATSVRVTDTMPSGFSYVNGWWTDSVPWPTESFPDPTIIGNQLIWDLPEVPVNRWHGFNIQLSIDGGVSPTPEVENCAAISGESQDDNHANNVDCTFFPINPPGPNLRVEKQHDWNGDGQIDYEIRVDNLGSETISDVWLTDTLPVDTHWAGWWDGDLDWNRLVGDIIVDGDQLLWNFSELYPGDRMWIWFSVNLDNPGDPMVWYTNTVEITSVLGEINPYDNFYEDAAFSGPEIEYVELNVADNYLWGRSQGHPVTISTAYEQVILDGGDFDWHASQNFTPGDVISMTAGAGLAPVIIEIPDPFDVEGSSLTDQVWGQLDHLDTEWIAVDLYGGPTMETQTDSDGNFDVTFPDIPRGGEGEVRYGTMVDWTDVTFHRYWRSPDLMLNVNYGHDWVEAPYELGHTLWITVTESDGVTVKATAEVNSQYIDDWGNTGFTPADEDWVPDRPDIQPGDWVYGRVENGFSSEVQVFTINGSVDVDADSLTGDLYAPWYIGVIDIMDVQCHPWGAWNAGWDDAPNKYSTASPDGSLPYHCEWDPNTEWDVDYGQDIGVWVPDEDGDYVINAFQGEAVEMAVWKWHQGNYARPDGVVVYGIYYHNNGSVAAENVLISDELPPFTTYADDTSGFPLTLGPGNSVTWDLGTVWPGQDGYIWVTLDVSSEAPLGEGVIEPNCASISTSTTPEIDPGNEDSCSDPVDVWEDEVELSINKWSEPHDPTPGQEFVYKLQWCNYRGAAAGPALLTDTLPDGVTLMGWQEGDSWMSLWSEVSFVGNTITWFAPGLPGDECREIELYLLLEPDVPIGTELVNTAVIDVADDVYLDNNIAEHTFEASPPRYDLGISKQFHNGELYPGGTFNYFINYDNYGNIASSVVMTEIVPSGLIFNGAWWGGSQEGENEPLPDPVIDGDLLIWNLDPLPINGGRWFHIEFLIDPDIPPGTEFGNCVEIAGEGPDDNPDDNTACETITVNPPGPNLRVFKESQWQNNNQELYYEITFRNVGSESFFNIVMTDTLPLGTSMNGDPWNDYWNPIQNIDLGGNVWQFVVDELNPGDMGRIYFNVSLDDPGQRPVWYTNNVEIETPPGDVDPGDNFDEDVAFTGGELSRVEFWLNQDGSSNMWGEAVPGATVTVTTPHDQYFAWADPDCGGCWNIEDTGLIEPGDVVEVIAADGIIPVVVTIPDPLVAEVDTGADEVFGQIGGWFNRRVEVHGGWDDGYREVNSDGAGNFLASYPDIPRGSGGYIRFIDEIDYAEVIFHRPFHSLDLVLEVNYGHDWVKGSYEPGHTIWITVTESDGTTVKGVAELTSDYIPDWNDTGFSTLQDGWIGDRPDLLPDDWIFGEVDNGFTSEVQIGEITGVLDLGADTVEGTITAGWYVDPLAASCGVWEDGGPHLDFLVDPAGGSYLCEFAPTGWDLQQGQTVGVAYQEPDGDWVINVSREPVIVQEIPLDAGWNMISSYAQPQDCRPDTIFGPIVDDMILLKNGWGDVYWPAMGIDNIGCWQPEHGYQLYMLSPATLLMGDEVVNPQDWPLDLDYGWSLISYLRDDPLAVDQALLSIESELVLAKNGFGEVYWPAYNVNQIGTMQPGQGYQVYLVNPATLTYPASNTESSRLVVDQLFAGLVDVDDETGELLPGLATSWPISADRTVYTFTLRSDAVWSDSNPLTAHDVRYAILRNLHPDTGSYRPWLLYDINNAQDFNEGEIIDPNLVGVIALDNSHLRFELNRPSTTFPSILTQPEARPLPEWAITAHPDNWTEPENIVTSGAYLLDEWSHGTSLALVKNPTYYDSPTVQIEEVQLSLLDEGIAWDLYQADEFESVLVPQDQWAAAQSDPILQPQLHTAPRHCTNYYGFNTSLPPFDDPLVRQAFASAIDRQDLIDQALGYAQLPALTFTAPGVFGHVDGYTQNIGYPFNPTQAQQWLSDAGYPGGAGLPPITLWYNTSPQHQAVAEYIQQSWLDNLGVSVALAELPWEEYLALIRTGSTQISRVGWCADYPDAYNFLQSAINSAQHASLGWWNNPTYDSLLELAGEVETDPLVRQDLYQQAEEILVEDDTVIVPLYYFANGIATKPTLTRTYAYGGYGGNIADWLTAVPADPIRLNLAPNDPELDPARN